MIFIGACVLCKHSKLIQDAEGKDKLVCEAFPNGIPETFDGDMTGEKECANGIRFEKG